MADNNNPIKNPYQSGTSLDISSIVSVLTELNANSRDTLSVLNQLKNYVPNNSSNNTSNITYKELEKLFRQYVQGGFKESTTKRESYGRPNITLDRDVETFNSNVAKTAKSLKELTDTYTQIQKDTKELEQDVDRNIRELSKSGLGKNLSGFKSRVGQLSNEIENIKNSFKGINSLYDEIAKETSKNNNNLRKQFDDEKRYLEDINKIKNKELESSYRLLRLSTDMTSKAEKFIPDNVKQWNATKASIKSFINPKTSEEYISYMEDYSRTKTDLEAQKSSNIEELSKVSTMAKPIQEAVNKLNESIEKAKENNDIVAQEQLNASLEEESRKLSIYQLEMDRLDRENDLIDTQLNVLEEEKKTVQNNSTFSKNIATKLTDTLIKTISKAVDRELSNLQSAADTMFNVIEETQKTLGKTLKMNSGQYTAFVDKMQALAGSLGVSVTSDQLLEAAATASQVGITDENILGQLAVMQAKLDETGTFFQMDEEFMKNIEAQYFQNIQEGMSESEASSKLQKTIDLIIATQQGLAQNYGSATAMASGGSNELFNILNESVKAGNMKQEDFQKNFYEVMSMMETIDINRGDASTLLEVITSLRDNPVGDLSTDLKAFLQQSGLSQNEILDAINSGNMADVLMKYIEHIGATYTATDQTSLMYQSKAYSPNLTISQLNAFKNMGEGIVSEYSENLLTESDISQISTDISNSIEKGDYLTATEELEKRNLTLMEDIAQSAQKIADGQFWMDQGFNVTSNILNTVLASLLAFLAGSGGGGFFTGGLGDKNKTLSGAIGKYGTMAAGGALSTYTLIKHTGEDGLKEGLLESFRDPAFTSGLGMTIGGSLGGPIGGAVGAALGAYVPEVSKGLENLLGSTLVDPAKELQDIETRNAELLQQAAESLSQAADKHSANIDELKVGMNKQLSIFDTYTSSQKAAFIEQMDLTQAEMENLAKEQGLTTDQLDSNTIFKAAVQKWIEQQNAKIEEEKALERGTSLVQGSLANVVGVNNAFDWSTEHTEQVNTEGKQDTAKRLGLNWEDIKDLSQEEKAKLFTETEEQKLNTQVFLENESGTQLLSDIEAYAKNNGIKDFSQAASEYLQKIDPNLYTGEDLTTATSVLQDAEKYKQQYDKENGDFHKKIEDVLKANPNISTYQELFDAYKKANSQFEYSAVEGLDWEAGGNVTIDGVQTIAKDSNGNITLPNLRYSSGYKQLGGKYGAQFNMSHMNYNPEFYQGKYRTGLDFVPMDDYLALLHQGEMVLNKSEAEEYRKNSNGTMSSLLNVGDTLQQAMQTTINNIVGKENSVIDISSITGSVNTQTDKLADILTKILQVLISGTTGKNRSYLPKSLVQMNSDISLL